MTIHVVKRGENLSAIARRYGIDSAELAFANQLRAPDVLAVGQALVVPVEQVFYTVRRGDSVYAIARNYGVAPETILRANPLAAIRIFPGQRLTIPFPNENLGRAAVNGYITRASAATLRATLPYLTWLSPFFVRTDAAGELTVTEQVSEEASREFRTANLLTLTNLKAQGGFSSAAAHGVLTDREAQDNLLENLFDLLESGDWYGVNLDFEYVYPYDRGSFNQFLRRLAEALHDRGYLLVTAVAPKTRAAQPGLLYEAHDYAAHGAAADYVIVMTYE